MNKKFYNTGPLSNIYRQGKEPTLGLSLVCWFKTYVEGAGVDKHSSLFRYGISYERKHFYNTSLM